MHVSQLQSRSTTRGTRAASCRMQLEAIRDLFHGGRWPLVLTLRKKLLDRSFGADFNTQCLYMRSAISFTAIFQESIVHNARSGRTLVGPPPPSAVPRHGDPHKKSEPTDSLFSSSFGLLVLCRRCPRVPLRAARAPPPLPLRRQPEACLLQLAALCFSFCFLAALCFLFFMSSAPACPFAQPAHHRHHPRGGSACSFAHLTVSIVCDET